MKVEDFGVLNGVKVYSIQLSNKNDVVVEIITYGAILKNVFINDKNGTKLDVVIGCDELQGYVNDRFSMGATIGRVTNRIANAQFTLDGKLYSLVENDKPNHLHGNHCLSRKIWDYEVLREADSESVRLTTTSHDGEFGYPSDVKFTATYTLNSQNQIKLCLEAQNLSAQKTIVNMTNHSYFNLEESDSIFDHVLQLDADSYLPVDENALPTGETRKLTGELQLLQKGTVLSKMVNNSIINIDNDFVKSKNDGAVRLRSPESGIQMTITSTNPVYHIYCAQTFENVHGKKGKTYKKCCAIAIEPQKHSNAINVPTFPSIVLDGLSKYSKDITYTFSIVQ